MIKIKTSSKQLFKIPVLMAFMASFLFSCSSDSGDTDIPPFQGDIEIKQVMANKVTIRLNGSTTSGISYGVREEGESAYIKTPTSLGEVVINDLLPATKYELTLFANEVPDFTYKVIKFTTPPFNTIEDKNSKIPNRVFNYYSEKGFKHSLRPDVFNENANIKFFFIDQEDSNKTIELTYTYANGLINFTVPENSISSEPYQEVKGYYLGYKLGNENIEKLNYENDLNAFITFAVFNPDPKITGVNYIKEDRCSGKKEYRLNFSGYFFSNLFEDRYNYYFDTSTIFITRLDDQSEIVLQEKSIDCITYYRSVNSNIVSPFGLNYLHIVKTIELHYPDIDASGVKFTKGDYKMKITFSSNEVNNFYETNTFLFTLP